MQTPSQLFTELIQQLHDFDYESLSGLALLHGEDYAREEFAKVALNKFRGATEPLQNLILDDALADPRWIWSVEAGPHGLPHIGSYKVLSSTVMESVIFKADSDTRRICAELPPIQYMVTLCADKDCDATVAIQIRLWGVEQLHAGSQGMKFFNENITSHLLSMCSKVRVMTDGLPGFSKLNPANLWNCYKEACISAIEYAQSKGDQSTTADVVINFEVNKPLTPPEWAYLFNVTGFAFRHAAIAIDDLILLA